MMRLSHLGPKQSLSATARGNSQRRRADRDGLLPRAGSRDLFLNYFFWRDFHRLAGAGKSSLMMISQNANWADSNRPPSRRWLFRTPTRYLRPPTSIDRLSITRRRSGVVDPGLDQARRGDVAVLIDRVIASRGRAANV